MNPRTWSFGSLCLASLLLVNLVHADEPWMRLTPPPLDVPALAYDSTADRMWLVPRDGGSPAGEIWTRGAGVGLPWQRVQVASPSGMPWRLRQVFVDVASRRLVAIVALPQAGGVSGGTSQSGLTAYFRPLDLASPWTRFQIAGDLPPDRTDFTFVHDTKRDRYVLFGGEASSTLFQDAWALRLAGDAAHWELLAFHPPPEPRAAAGGAYDPAHDQLVLFGGRRGLGGGAAIDPSDDLVLLSLSAGLEARRIDPVGTWPAAASRAAATWDATRSQGIFVTRESAANAIWSLDLASGPVWQRLGTARGTSSGDVALFGPNGAGFWFALVPPLDTYRIRPEDPAAWKPVDLVLRFGPTSSPRIVLTDPTDGTYLAVAGWSVGESRDIGLWRIAPTTPPTWTRLADADAGTFPGVSAAFAYDARRGRWILTEGVRTWALTVGAGATCTPLATRGPVPARVRGTAAAYDALRDRVIVFGGGPLAGTDSVFVLDLSGPPTWSRASVRGRGPHARLGAAMIWDAAHDRAIVFGGLYNDPGGVALDLRTHYLRDTWTLTGGDTLQWDSLAVEGQYNVSPQSSPLAFFDPARNAMGVVGGSNRTAVPDYTLSIPEELRFGPPAGWDPRPTSTLGVPTGSGDAILGPLPSPTAFDVDRDRLFATRYLGQAWLLDRGQPTHVALLDLEPGDPSNTLPAGANGTVAAAILGSPAFDARTVDPSTVTLAGAPAQSGTAVAAADRATLRDVNHDGLVDRVLQFRRADMTLDPTVDVVALAGRTRNGEAVVGWDLYRLGEGNVHGRGTGPSGALAANGDPDAPTDTAPPLDLSVVGPVRSVARVRLALPRAVPQGAVIELFAVDGRRVARHELPALAAGYTDFTLEETRGLAPGVYFARLRVGGATARAKFVALR